MIDETEDQVQTNEVLPEESVEQQRIDEENTSEDAGTSDEGVDESATPLEENTQEATVDSIECYLPKELNINYRGEWVLKLGALCYGISVRGADNKVMITYNINPDGLHPDHFVECATSMVPAKILEMFQKKLSTDIMRLDNMMLNLVSNKAKLNELFNFAENNRSLSTVEIDYDVSEYSEEDAHKDKQLDALKAQQQTQKLPSGKKKLKAKTKKKLAKKSRRK